MKTPRHVYLQAKAILVHLSLSSLPSSLSNNQPEVSNVSEGGDAKHLKNTSFDKLSGNETP